MAKTLGTLQASLKRKTANQLTATADQNTYLVLAWEKVQGDWAKFDSGLFRDPAKKSAATDTSGVLEVDADIMRLERAEDGSKIKYGLISNIDDINDVTGYYFAGYDTTSNKREVVFIKNGAVKASTTFSYYQIKRYALSTNSTTTETRLPDEYADLIPIKAAQLWHEDQGPPMQKTAETWEARYNRELSAAKAWYKNLTKDVMRAPCMDPETGGGFATTHNVS